MKLQILQYGFVLMLALGTISAGPSGCASMQGGSAQAADRQLSAKVRHVLKRDPVYKFAAIDVSASNGTIQLSGFTSSEKEKQRAQELAKQVDGVNEVINRIIVQ